VQTTITCPRCQVERQELGLTRPPVGPPFEHCPACGELTARPGYNEWALLGPSVRLGHLLRRTLRAASFGVLPVLLYLGFNLSGGLAVDLLVVLALSALGLGAAGTWVVTRTAGEIARSRRRMTDPMYLAKLAKFAKSSTAPVLDETKPGMERSLGTPGA